ncbi:TSUP family transporter [Roseivirga sp. BDSF3-8]|uniref:TSUP family transporter n=1 Tax=Roseivirga sp. BDSF3-8 TaxID=3241598 RepID=UPI0035322DCB
MEYVIIGIAALLTSLLTFISGFGLGTLLMPVFAVFFPIQTAISLTAVVHFLNNLFKLLLIGRAANRDIVIRFGVPAIAGAAIGAYLLSCLSDAGTLYSYTLGSIKKDVSFLKFLIGALIILFAFLELKPLGFRRSGKVAGPLTVGGLLSGFFGGLSGHQGALRSAFLIKLGLSKEAFIACGIIIATFIDVTRLSIYFSNFDLALLSQNTTYLVVGTLSAFAGAFAGKLLLKKVTLAFVHVFVAAALFLLGFAMMAGLV